MDGDDSVKNILYLARTDGEGLPPKYFGRCYYKMPEVVADKVKHYFVNLSKEKRIMKIGLKEKRTPQMPDEAFLFEKVAFKI